MQNVSNNSLLIFYFKMDTLRNQKVVLAGSSSATQCACVISMKKEIEFYSFKFI